MTIFDYQFLCVVLAILAAAGWSLKFMSDVALQAYRDLQREQAARIELLKSIRPRMCEDDVSKFMEKQINSPYKKGEKL
jgi:hypothetical protein